MKSSNPTAQANRRYLVSFTIVMVAYVVLLFASITAVERFAPTGVLRYVLLLVPVVPVGFLIAAMIRYLRETDEFERRIQLESMAIAVAVTAGLSVTYGFLESAGFPRLSAWWTWGVVVGSWGIARFFVARHYR